MKIYLSHKFGLAFSFPLTFFLDDFSLLFDHGLESLFVDGLAAGAHQVILECGTRLNKLALLRIEFLLDLLQFRFQFLLVHRQRMHLPLQDLHASCSHDRTDIGHHNVGEDLVHQSMIADVASVSYVLDRHAVVNVFFVFSRLNFNSSRAINSIFNIKVHEM